MPALVISFEPVATLRNIKLQAGEIEVKPKYSRESEAVTRQENTRQWYRSELSFHSILKAVVLLHQTGTKVYWSRASTHPAALLLLTTHSH